MSDMTKAIQAAEIAPQDTGANLKEIIKSNWDKIAQVAPKHMNSDRLYQLAISAINQTPQLAECDVSTVLSCLMKCSALGLEPSAVDGLGRAYIIPRRNSKSGKMEATFLLGYKGMIDLARRSEEIQSIEAHAVYEGDAFTYEIGLDTVLKHTPKGETDPAKLTHVYMVAKFMNGGHHIEVMTRNEIEDIKKRSQATNPKYSPWATDYAAMAKKTVIRRAFTYLPIATEAMKAAAEEEASEMGYKTQAVEPIIKLNAATGEIVGE